MHKVYLKLELQKTTNHVLKVRDFVFDLIFPKTCLGCNREGDWFCPECFKKLEFAQNQYCLHCKNATEHGEFCPRCKDQYFLDGVLIAGNYDNQLLSRLIKFYKYHFVQEIGQTLGSYLIKFLQDIQALNPQIPKILNIPNIPTIIPVPLHSRRLRWRGFNQAEELAKIVAQNFNLTIDSKNLVRTKHKNIQAKLKERERRANISNCFVWLGANLDGANILLVDDVVTTGSTLNECAKILKQNGANNVWGLVVAKG